jgi:hypothetical protein
MKMKTEIRELTDADLDMVSGGMDGYKFCWNGPAGTGTYPVYIDCGGGGGGGEWGTDEDAIYNQIKGR